MSKKTTSSKKKVMWIAVIIITLMSAGFAVWFARASYLEERRFNSAVWKNAETSDRRDIRRKMVGDLLKDNYLIGMSSAKAEALLGFPTSEEYFNDTCDSVYRLGRANDFSIDSSWLCLSFAQDKSHIIDARVVYDD